MYLSGIKNRFNTILSKYYYKICFGRNIAFGKGTHFRKSFIVNIREKGKIKIGNDCFFNNYCSINSLSSIEIGDNCIFGESVKIYDHDHVFYKHQLISKQGYKKDRIMIGKNCWIGSNVVILRGTEIGDNCVIGAGIIVKGKIPSDSILKRKDQVVIEKIIRK